MFALKEQAEGHDRPEGCFYRTYLEGGSGWDGGGCLKLVLKPPTVVQECASSTDTIASTSTPGQGDSCQMLSRIQDAYVSGKGNGATNKQLT